MDDSMDDLLDLQDEIMEDEEAYYNEEYENMIHEGEENDQVPGVKTAKTISAAAAADAGPSPKKTSRDIDMIGYKATNVEYENSRPYQASSNQQKQKTPEEFAKFMQEVRMATVGSTDSANNVTKSLFVLANEYMHEKAPVLKLKLRDVAACTSIVPRSANNDNEFCPLVLSNGRRVYICDRTIEEKVDEALKHAQFDPYKKNLLSVSYDELSRQMDEIETQARLSRARHIEQQLANTAAGSNTSNAGKDENKELWVDKYSPQSFTQLLSAEKTNRDVLKALKRWDKFVFKREINMSSLAKADEDDAQTKARLFSYDGRPRNKVIMLCGPPGTGKTTLAHVAALHCGYRPVEVNASDDRSPEALKELLARATQNATLDQDKRPNCIIFDEIDGMDGNKKALEMLLDVIKAPLTTSKNQGAKKSKKTGSKASASATTASAVGSFSLTRPLICICNDQYAPVLRDLRKLSDIFVFSLPSISRMAQRLKHICLSEHIDVSRPAVLNELISITGHDIRSTINNLQFAAMKAKDKLSQSSASSSSNAPAQRMDLAHVISAMMQTGLKDDQLDSYQVWQRIFSARPPANASDRNHSSGNNTAYNTLKTKPTKYVEESQMLLAVNAMQDHGDYEHLVAGIHENIIPRPPPPSKFSQQIGLPPPPSAMHTSSVGNVLSRFALSYDWLSYTDTMMQGMRTLSDGFQLLPHIAMLGGAVHFCHAITKPSSSSSSSSNTSSPSGGGTMRFEWPKKDRDIFYAQQQRVHILELFQQQFLQRAHSTVISKQAVSVDCVSALLDIFTPRVRPLPMLSLSANEKATLLRVVQSMESCGVTYTPLAVADEREAAEMLGNNQPTSANSFFKKPGFPSKHNNNYNKNNTNHKQDASSVFLQDNVIMVMEPNLSLLVRYQNAAGQEELRGRHTFVSSDLRNIIFTEQRKYAIAQWETRVAARSKAEAEAEERSLHHSGHHNNSFFNNNNNNNNNNQKTQLQAKLLEKDSFLQEEEANQQLLALHGIDSDEAQAMLAANAKKTTHTTTSSSSTDAVKKETTASSATTTAATAAAAGPNPWERVQNEAEEEAKRSRGSLSSFLIKRPASEISSTASTAKSSAAATATAATTTMFGAKKAKTSADDRVPAGSNTTSTGTTSGSHAAAVESTAAVVHKPKPATIFKFNQGYSNAVRRPVYLHDFLALPSSSSTSSTAAGASNN